MTVGFLDFDARVLGRVIDGDVGDARMKGSDVSCESFEEGGIGEASRVARGLGVPPCGFAEFAGGNGRD